MVLGAYAEYLATSTTMLIHKPVEISWTLAAAIPEVHEPSDAFLKDS